MESVKAAADIYAPITGEVVGVNDDLEKSPQLINKEPHAEGWMFKIKVSEPEQLEGLMNSSDYEKSIENA